MFGKIHITLLVFLLLIFSCVLWYYNSRLYGPFVFADESEYRLMIDSVINGSWFAGHKQYGPLYPSIVALVIALKPAVSIHLVARVLNSLFALGAFLAFFFLSKQMLKSTWLIWPAIVIFVLSPFWTFVIVTWAEPLFYFLLYVSLYLVYKTALLAEFNKVSAGHYILLGFFGGLLFLTKPVGIFYEFSMFISFLIIFWLRASSKKAIFKSMFSMLIPMGILTISWIARNIFIEHTSMLGYSYVGKHLTQLLQQQPLYLIVLHYIYGVCYQLSYVIMSSLGTAFFVFFFAVKYWRCLAADVRMLIMYVMLSLITVSLVSTIHMLGLIDQTLYPGLGYWVPNGRYLTCLVPVFILLYLRLYQQFGVSFNLLQSKQCMCGLVVALSVVYLATPLQSLGAFMIVNAPDFALYFHIVDGDKFPWRTSHDPNYSIRLVSVALSAVAILPFLLKRRVGVVIFAIVMIVYFFYTSLYQAGLIRVMAESQKPVNKFITASLQSESELNLCTNSHIYFDKSLENYGFRDIYSYWCPRSKIRFTSLEELCKIHLVKKYSEYNFIAKLGDISFKQSPIIYMVGDFAVYKLSVNSCLEYN